MQQSPFFFSAIPAPKAPVDAKGLKTYQDALRSEFRQMQHGPKSINLIPTPKDEPFPRPVAMPSFAAIIINGLPFSVGRHDAPLALIYPDLSHLW